MKTLRPFFLLLLITALAFALASCSVTIGGERYSNQPKETTAGATSAETRTSSTAAKTTAEGTTAEGTCAHVREQNYTVDVQPSCTTAGRKSYHCTLCGEIIHSFFGLCVHPRVVPLTLTAPAIAIRRAQVRAELPFATRRRIFIRREVENGDRKTNYNLMEKPVRVPRTGFNLK